NDRVERACETAWSMVDSKLRRRFTPFQGTRYFDWPSIDYRTPWRLWLDRNTLISLDSVTSGGTTLTGLLPEPVNDGPPYTRLETNRATNSAYVSGATPQRNIAVTGLFGHTDTAETV